MDLSLAALIGISSVGSILLWSPQGADLAAQRSLKEGRLIDVLSDTIGSVGLVWTRSASWEEICSRIGSLSNGTTTTSAAIDGHQCEPGPPADGLVATLAIQIGHKTVILEAWQDVGR